MTNFQTHNNIYDSLAVTKLSQTQQANTNRFLRYKPLATENSSRDTDLWLEVTN